MSDLRLAISLADSARSVASSWLRHDNRSAATPDVQSANAGAQAIAVMKIAAPAVLIMQISPSLSFRGYSAVIPVASSMRPHFSIEVFRTAAAPETGMAVGS